MADILQIATYYLEDKPIYPPLRKILNLIFNISITAFVYERIFGSYQWLDIDDYKGILDFVFKGKLFICLSIYIPVYGTIKLFSYLVFNFFKKLKYKEIENLVLKYPSLEAEQGFHGKLGLISVFSYVLMYLPVLLAFKSNAIRPTKAIQNDFSKEVKNLRDTFKIFLKGLIIITITKYNVPEFGWILYGIISIVLASGLIVTIAGYRYFLVLPRIIDQIKVNDSHSIPEIKK